MRRRSRLLLFILLNIVISSITTLTILWAWERTHPRPEVGIITESSEIDKDPLTSSEQIDHSAPTKPIVDFTNEDILISIRAIVGAGDLEVEYVEIINQGEQSANLTEWQLVDEDGHTFTFPTLILNSRGAIKILSKTGTNTVIELYWQSDEPIWESGETARLINTAGEVVTTYSIP